MVFVFFTCFLYFNFKRVIVLKTFLNKLSGVQFDKAEIEMSFDVSFTDLFWFGSSNYTMMQNFASRVLFVFLPRAVGFSS